MSINIAPVEGVVNLSNTIYNELKKQILNMELLPGEKMSEVKMTKIWDCSRTPVREAFYQLRLEGFLESKPQVGTFVPKIDMFRVEEVRFLRESVETAVIKYGMQKNLFASYIDQLQDLINRQETVYANREYSAFNELDAEFHGLFQKATGKEFAMKYCGNNDIHYTRLRHMSVRYETNPHIAIEHHQRVLDAVKCGNISEMEQAMASHLSNLYQVLKTTELNNHKIIANYQEFMEKTKMN